MSYHIYLFRKEVKEENKGFEFLERDELITPFTDEQFKGLKKRLSRYGFEITNEQSNSVQYNFKGGQHGIEAWLTKAQLSFTSGFSQDGIFEINMTASEFVDTGEFAKLDPQEGKWEV